MSKWKRVIKDLEEVIAGKPVKQTIIRKMNVKGKTVYTRESFTAPIQPGLKKGRTKKR